MRRPRSWLPDADDRGYGGGLTSRAERFATLTQDLLGATDERGRLTWTNPAWERVLGWGEDELAGRSYAELLHPDDRAEAAAAEARLRRAEAAAAEARLRAGGSGPAEDAEGSGPAEEVELRVRTRSGDHRRISFRVWVPPGEAAVFLSGRDVTEQRLALAELASMGARYRGVVEHLPGAIVALFDRDLRLTLVDGPQLERRRLRPQDFVGLRLPDLLAAGRVPDLIEHVDAMVAGEARSFDFRSLDGRVEYRVHLIPIDDPDADAIGMGLMIDVTAERATARALERRTRALERSNAELEAFAYAASHDLLTPLRSVTGFVQLLRRRYHGRLDADADELIDHAVAGTARMRSLIDDLLAYGRLGGEPAAPGPVALAELAASAADLVRADAEPPPRIAIGELPTVAGDPRALEQLLFNLLQNAVKYVPAGEAADVTVSAERIDGGWRVTVADRGIGVEPEHAERIFRMFHRLHAADAYAGTGIGLSIAAKAVEQHGGEIGVEPNPGGGSRFWFSLPDR